MYRIHEFSLLSNHTLSLSESRNNRARNSVNVPFEARRRSPLDHFRKGIFERTEKQTYKSLVVEIEEYQSVEYYLTNA